MKPAKIALSAAGCAVLLAGLWTSFVLPVRTTTETLAAPSGVHFVETARLTLWGRPTHFQSHVTFASPDQKPHGEGVGLIPDKWIAEGSVSWNGAKSGRWIRRERNGEKWEEKILWYIDDKQVTREEWERRR